LRSFSSGLFSHRFRLEEAERRFSEKSFVLSLKCSRGSRGSRSPYSGRFLRGLSRERLSSGFSKDERRTAGPFYVDHRAAVILPPPERVLLPWTVRTRRSLPAKVLSLVMSEEREFPRRGVG